MPRDVRIAAQISTFKGPLERLGDRPLDPIVLFCGIGLLAFLVAILTGVQGAWY
jgi:hypothetical protein